MKRLSLIPLAFLALSPALSKASSGDPATTTMPDSLGTAPAWTLRIRGDFTGSDRIHINTAGASWQNLHWGAPASPIRINGVPWQPRHQTHLLNRGETRFLPAGDWDLARATLRVIQGRDAVALETSGDEVVLHIADTPPGASTYELAVRIEPRREGIELRIQATIDGSDVLRIDRHGAHWTNRHWGAPSQAVRLNELSWNVRTNPKLENGGATRFLPDDVDLASAELIERSGRDLVSMQRHQDGLKIQFADNPNGSAIYKLRIRFRSRYR